MGRYISKVTLSQPIDGDSYLTEIPAVRYFIKNRFLDLTHDVTYFVGENGAGKSTLIEAIAVAYGFNPEGGTKNFCFSTADSHSSLWKHLTLSRHAYPKDGFFLRAESFYNVATQIDELDSQPAYSVPLTASYGGVSLHCRSHGESFLALIENRFGGNGLYILDEPEAALSPMSLMKLLVLLDELVKRNSQFIIATHSPILMAFPGAQILQLSQDGIAPVRYQETEHYQITKRFLDNPNRMLKYLLAE